MRCKVSNSRRFLAQISSAFMHALFKFQATGTASIKLETYPRRISGLSVLDPMHLLRLVRLSKHDDLVIRNVSICGAPASSCSYLIINVIVHNNAFRMHFGLILAQYRYWSNGLCRHLKVHFLEQTFKVHMRSKK